MIIIVLNLGASLTMPWWLYLGAPEATSVNWNEDKAHVIENKTNGNFSLGKA